MGYRIFEKKYLKNVILTILLVSFVFVGVCIISQKNIAHASNVNYFSIEGENDSTIIYKTTFDLNGFENFATTPHGSQWWNGSWAAQDVKGAIGDGAYATLKEGDKLTITGLNLSGLDGHASLEEVKYGTAPSNVLLPGLVHDNPLRQSFLGFAFYPSEFTVGASATKSIDARKFTVRFTDGVNRYDFVYVSFADGSSTTTGYYNGVQVSVNGGTYGSMRSSINGGREAAGSVVGAPNLISRFFYDAETTSFSAANAQNALGFGVGQYLGQATTLDVSNLTVQMWFDNYVNDSAAIYVYDVLGVDIKKDVVKAPKINIDYGLYSKDILPTMQINKEFELFNAILDSGEYSVSVTGPDGLPVNVINNKIVPTILGNYEIKYNANDVFGLNLTSSETIILEAKNILIEDDVIIDTSNLFLDYGDGKNGLEYGKTLNEIKISGISIRYKNSSEAIPGEFKFSGENHVPSVLNGQTKVYLEFVPQDVKTVSEIMVPIYINVIKARPVVDVEVYCITQNLKVNDVVELNGVFRDIDGVIIEGEVTLLDELKEGVNEYTWLFTPYNSNYENVSGTITLKAVAVQKPSGDIEIEELDGSTQNSGCSGSIMATDIVLTVSLLSLCGMFIVVKRRNEND